MNRLAADPHPDQVGADVAGDLEDLGGAERLVAVGLGVVDLAVGDLEHRRDVERGARRDHAVLERAGDRDRLERRARLVAVGHGVVAIGEAAHRVGIVGVDARPVGQSQDRARVGVHRDRGRGPGRVLRADPRQHLLHLVLERGVERQLQRLARLHRPDLVDRDRLVDGVVDDPPLARRAREVRVVPILQAGVARARAWTPPSTCAAVQSRGYTRLTSGNARDCR